MEEKTGSHKKNCFGILDHVFPMGKEGLREVPPCCHDCSDKIACLKEALDTEQGLMLKGEALDRLPSSGLLSRLKRWSDRKDLNRRIKEKRGKK